MNDYNVYFRNIDGSLGQMQAENCDNHKEAILSVKEVLVEQGSDLTKMAVLAVINGKEV